MKPMMTTATACWLLIVAGVLDVLWAVAMKYADGYTRTGWSLVSLFLLAAFVWLLGRSLTVLPVGTAYAVWTGIGAIGTVAAGAWLFGEPLGAMRLCGIALVLAGIVVLKLVPAAAAA
jgi:quaternary ammonium compound-resistance protein SugE